MFTGIIEETGLIKSVQRGSRSVCLTVAANNVLEEVKTGDSICVNGVCLTVVSFNLGAFSADVMPETMRRSNLGSLGVGNRVNLERAMKLTDRLGGHLVSGHIDGTGSIRTIREDDNAVRITVAADKPVLRYIIEKGSVALDGISLTVVKVDDVAFEVSVIPHTYRNTTLETRKAGDFLNIECDMIAKYIEKLLVRGRDHNKINPGFLAEHGFM